MAKQNGLGWTTLSVDDAASAVVAIKNDVTEFNFATPRAPQDVTGVDKSAIERILNLADFSIDLKGVFNLTVSHTVFRTVPSTSVARTVTLTISGATLANECLFTDYAVSRSSSGELTWSAPGVLADGAVPTWA
jgi:hypothetical protein